MHDTILDARPPSMEKLYPVFKRLLAFLMDVIFLGLLILSIIIFCTAQGVAISFFYPFIVLVPLYKCWMEWKKGATLGKRVMRILVVKAKDHTALTWQQAILRNLVFFPYAFLLIELYYTQDRAAAGNYEVYRQHISWIFTLEEYILFYVTCYSIGCLFLFFSPIHRTLYDYLGGTVCVNKMELIAS
ncbi:MAG: RDD family protein [Aureispira sp.]